MCNLSCINLWVLKGIVVVRRNLSWVSHVYLSRDVLYFLFIDIRAHWRFCSLPRCWIYREFPVHWSISSVTKPWSTCDLQFGKYVFSWCGKLVSWGLQVSCFMHLIKCGKNNQILMWTYHSFSSKKLSFMFMVADIGTLLLM